jgi:curli biogenesis system outer membrane secretion channel CsgG
VSGWGFGVLLLLLVGCASTAQVTRGGGDAIALIQALDPGARPRVAVGAIIDKTGGKLGTEMSLLGELEPVQNGVLQGVRDMLITELFGSGRFIVLERDALDAVLSEQEFSRSARVGDVTRIPQAQLEGADFIVLGALTAFDAGADGGALPIPIPLSERGDWGVLNLSAKRGHVAMDLRLIETRTGRVVHSTAVEGRNWSMGLDFAGLFRSGRDIIRLPGLLKLFSNTPVEEALQKMVTAATQRIADAATR